MRKTIIAILFSLAFSLNAYASDFDTAYQLQMKGKYQEAIEYYNKSLKSNPNDIKILNNLASMYQLTGKSDQAITTIKKALEINPKNEMSHYILGDIYLSKDDDQSALEEFKKVIEINPKFPFVYQPLSTIYYRAGYYEVAIKAVKKAIELLPENDPQKEVLHRNLLKAYYDLEKYDLATEELDLIKKLYPNSTFDYDKFRATYLKRSNDAEYFKNNYSTLPSPEKYLSVDNNKFILKWSDYSDQFSILEFFKDNEAPQKWTQMVTITSIPQTVSLKEYLKIYLDQTKASMIIEPVTFIEDSGEVYVNILLSDKSAKKVEAIRLRLVEFSETNKQIYIISRSIPYVEFNKDPNKFKPILESDLANLKKDLNNLNFRLFP